MSEIERESMEVDVLYVGAGPANLASAYHLMKQVEAHNESAEKTGADPIEPPVILVIEKAAGVGEHQLSGAVGGRAFAGGLAHKLIENKYYVDEIYDALEGGEAERALRLAHAALREGSDADTVEEDPVIRFLAGVALLVAGVAEGECVGVDGVAQLAEAGRHQC